MNTRNFEKINEGRSQQWEWMSQTLLIGMDWLAIYRHYLDEQVLDEPR